MRVFSTALIIAGLASAASAQTYPTQNITVQVAFAAGGIADVVARLVAQKLSERLGQTVVVENRGGAGGNLAAKSGERRGAGRLYAPRHHDRARRQRDGLQEQRLLGRRPARRRDRSVQPGRSRACIPAIRRRT